MSAVPSATSSPRPVVEERLPVKISLTDSLSTVEKVKQFVLYLCDCVKSWIWGRDAVFVSAFEKGHLYTAERWVDHIDLDVQGIACLHRAAKHSHTAMIALLKEKGVDIKASFIAAFNNGQFSQCLAMCSSFDPEDLQEMDQPFREKHPEGSSLMYQLGERILEPFAWELATMLAQKGCGQLSSYDLILFIDSCSDEELLISDNKGKTVAHLIAEQGRIPPSLQRRLSLFSSQDQENLALLFIDSMKKHIDRYTFGDLSVLISSGCGVKDGELSPAVQEAIDRHKDYWAWGQIVSAVRTGLESYASARLNLPD